MSFFMNEESDWLVFEKNATITNEVNFVEEEVNIHSDKRLVVCYGNLVR